MGQLKRQKLWQKFFNKDKPSQAHVMKMLLELPEISIFAELHFSKRIAKMISS
jgi:hypothetical protein